MNQLRFRHAVEATHKDHRNLKSYIVRWVFQGCRSEVQEHLADQVQKNISSFLQTLHLLKICSQHSLYDGAWKAHQDLNDYLIPF